MTELQIFENPEFGKIRGIEIDGEPWMVGKDVAEALGYSNTKDAISRHVDDEDKQILQRSENATFENHIPKSVLPFNFVPGDIPNRGLTIINESGLYSLIFSSKLPTAKQFKHWVTSEVLPSIRKTGSYSKHPSYPPKETSAGGIAQLLRMLRATMKENSQSPEVISRTVKMVCEQFGVMLPENFVKQIPFQQYIFEGML